MVRDLATSEDARERRAVTALFATRGSAGHDVGVLADLLADGDLEGEGRGARCGRPFGCHVPRARAPSRRRPRRASPRRTRGRGGASTGPAALPLVSAALAGDAPRRPSLVRAAAMLATEHGVDVVAPALEDSDRAGVLAALESLEAAGGRDSCRRRPRPCLPRCRRARHPRVCGPRCARGIGRLARACPRRRDRPRTPARDRNTHLPLRGARPRGRPRHRPRGGRPPCARCRGAGRLLTRPEAAVALPLVRRDALFGAGQPAAGRRPEAWIADMADDPDGVWRSEWLATCARGMRRSST